jgi:hypothetical protein
VVRILSEITFVSSFASSSASNHLNDDPDSTTIRPYSHSE